ncbi:MAG: hypothetical protein WD689_05130 [Gaiellaceae bacterium]
MHEEDADRTPLGRLARVALRLRRAPWRLEVDGEERAVHLLLVGNNEYRPGGRRERLDGGTLSAYSIERAGRLRLRTETRAGTRFVVRARSARVRAAIDGEPVELESPLEFELLRRALRVRLPA